MCRPHITDIIEILYMRLLRSFGADVNKYIFYVFATKLLMRILLNLSKRRDVDGTTNIKVNDLSNMSPHP